MITESDIHEGLQRDQFLLYYQPKISLVTGRIVGSEALVRWDRPNGSMLQPREFIPIAERSSLIKEMTTQIFSKLLEDLSIPRNVERTPVSFNVSAQSLQDTELANQLLNSIRTRGLEPKGIELEITETDMLNCGGRAMENISQLCEAGIGLAMDDYGTGYSSIDTLSKCPFTAIKLDQGIISRMLESEKSATIARSSIRLGHELKVDVVAEGIETIEQYEFLLEAGCKMGQGYLISKPLPLDQYIAFEEQEAHWAGIPIGLIHMAMMDHIQWRKQIVSYALKCARLPTNSPLRFAADPPPLSCRECALGQWYFGEGQAFSHHAPFRALDDSHRALHETGSQLVKQVRMGAGLHQITPWLKELTARSIAIIGTLQTLEDLVLADMYRAH